MRKKSFLAAALCAVAIAAVSAGSAFAGEITGPGTPTGVLVGDAVPTAAPEHTNSICAFSGLNHLHLDANGNPLPGELLTRTQSYGQLVAAGLKDSFPSPGVACNGNTGFLAGP
jgi:hypothetical protein